MKLTRAELVAFHGATVPDLLGPDVRLLFVGINPGLRTAAVQAHFAGRGNRFYPALHRAGLTEHLIDAADGIRPEDVAHLHARGIGITNLVRTASARADELSRQELLEGGRELAARVAAIRPAVVAILGVTAYRAAFAQPRAVTGRQPADMGGAQLWVAPNPSGLNAHAQIDDLAAAYREIAVAAGIRATARPGPARPARPAPELT